MSPGEGRNVNIAWSASDFPLSDAEYLAAMRTVVCPIVRNFNPGVILISAGFDATQGHPPTIGGYNVSPACFASMTSSMLQFAEGKTVLALEGGYVGPAVAESVLECLKVLLAESCSKVSTAELERTPLKQAVLDIEKTIAHLVSLAISHTWHFTSHLSISSYQSAGSLLACSERDQSLRELLPPPVPRHSSSRHHRNKKFASLVALAYLVIIPLWS